MKKIFALLLVMCMIFIFGACSGNSGDNETASTTAVSTSASGSDDFDIIGAPDFDVVGLWKYANDEEPTIFIFTPGNELQFVYGSTVVKGDIEFYTDKDGNIP